MLKKILLGLVAALAILFIVAALQPADFAIQRETKIAAPAEVVFAQVNDLHNWPAWSPWAKKDPEMKVTYDGPQAGTGSIYNWSGNSEVGEGRMTIVETIPNALVRIKLDFLKPFEASNVVDLALTPAGAETAIQWKMSGTNGFLFKLFGLFMNMDKMMGKDFELGLAQLKTLSEGAARK